MPEERRYDEASRVMAKARVEGARRRVGQTGDSLTLLDIVQLVLGDGDWEAIAHFTEFALIESPMISTSDLVDGILSLHEWSTANA